MNFVVTQTAMANKQQWTVLACSSLLAFAGNFFSDITTPLSRRLQGDSPACRNSDSSSSSSSSTTSTTSSSSRSEDKPPDHCLDLNSMEYNSLSTAFTYATGIVAVFAALALKQYGQKWMIWSAGALAVVGSFFFVGGSYLEDTTMAFSLLILGRVLYGAGNGLRAAVCSHRVNSLWKDSTQMKSLYILCARLGSASAYLLNGATLDIIGMSNAIWISVALTIAAAIGAVVQGRVDNNEDDTKGRERTLWDSTKKGYHHFAKHVEAIYWWFAIAYFLVHVIISTFTSNAPTLLRSKGGYTEMEAIWVISLVYDLSILVPLVGWTVDKTGRRDYWMTLGTVFLLTAFAAYLASDTFNSIVMTVLIGLGYAIFSPISSASTSIVGPEQTRGIANAILYFLRYIGAGTFSLIAGSILDRESDDGSTSDRQVWRDLIILLLVMAVIATVSSLGMIWANRQSKEQPLTITEDQRRSKEHAKEDHSEEQTPLQSSNFDTSNKYSSLPS